MTEQIAKIAIPAAQVRVLSDVQGQSFAPGTAGTVVVPPTGAYAFQMAYMMPSINGNRLRFAINGAATAATAGFGPMPTIANALSPFETYTMHKNVGSVGFCSEVGANGTVTLNWLIARSSVY